LESNRTGKHLSDSIEQRRLHILAALAYFFIVPVFAKDVISFDKFNAGALPPGWSAGITGDGKDKWLVTKDRSASSPHNVLEHRGDATFSWCVKDKAIFKDGSVAVKVRLEGGQE